MWFMLKKGKVLPINKEMTNFLAKRGKAVSVPFLTWVILIPDFYWKGGWMDFFYIYEKLCILL